MFRPAKTAATPIVETKRPTEIKIAPATHFPKKWLVGDGPIKLITDSLPDNKDAANLAQVSRFLFHTTKAPLDTRKLAHHVIVDPTLANKDYVIARLDAEPTLVSHKIEQAKDKIGRVIKNKTLFQLAYGAGDDDFCLAMKPAFIKHLGSEQAAIKEMERQRNEMFESEEECKKKDEACKVHFDTLLQPLIKAIDAEQFNLGHDTNEKLILSPATLAAINTFREEFAKSQPMAIEQGMHFRYNTLQETFNAYVQAAARWNYRYNKCALFEDGVLATVLSYVPVNDAQKFSQGLYYLQRENNTEPFHRSFALRFGGNNFYDVCRGASSDFALFGSCVDISLGRGALQARAAGPETSCFTILMSNKNIKLAELMQPIHPQPKP